MSDSRDDKSKNVIEFPKAKRKPTESYHVGYTTDSPPPSTQQYDDVPTGLSHMFFGDVPVTVHWQHDSIQKQKLWKVWNLCYRLQKQCLFSPHQSEVLEYLEEQLEQLINNIDTYQRNPNKPPTQE